MLNQTLDRRTSSQLLITSSLFVFFLSSQLSNPMELAPLCLSLFVSTYIYVISLTQSPYRSSSSSASSFFFFYLSSKLKKIILSAAMATRLQLAACEPSTALGLAGADEKSSLAGDGEVKRWPTSPESALGPPSVSLSLCLNSQLDDHRSATTTSEAAAAMPDELPQRVAASTNQQQQQQVYPRCVKREMSREAVSEEEEDGSSRNKKLRLTKEQSTLLEELFREQTTLNPKQKHALAEQLNLRPRQVEVWFQNRRARTKLKKTEMDCEVLKKCCKALTDENRRLKKELHDLKLQSIDHQAATAAPSSLCPSCETIVATAAARSSSGRSMFRSSMAVTTPKPAGGLLI